MNMATFPTWHPKNMADIVPGLEEAGVDLLTRLLTYNPDQRIDGKDALQHPYFAGLDASWTAKFQVR